MPKKAAPKDARKRTKQPGKIADLPAKSLKGKDAAAVKGGILNIEPANFKPLYTNLNPLSSLQFRAKTEEPKAQ